MRRKMQKFYEMRNIGDWSAAERSLELIFESVIRDILLSYILVEREDFDGARELLAEYLTSTDSLNHFGALVAQMHLCWTSKNVEEMSDLRQDAEIAYSKLSESQKDDYMYWVAIYLNLLSKLEKRTGEIDKAELLLRESMELFEKLGDVYAVVKSMINLSVIEKDKGEYEGMIETLFLAEKKLDLLDTELRINKKLRYMIKGNIASTYLKLKRYEDALKYYDANEQLVKEVGGKADYCILLINKGAAANALERYKQGTNYLNQAIELAERIDNQYLLAYCYRNRADVEFSQKLLTDALHSFEMSQEIAARQKIHLLMASNLSNIGLLKAYQGYIPEAMACFNQVMDMIDQGGGIYDPEFLISSYDNIAMIQAYLQNFSSALVYWQNHLKICQEVGDPRDIMGSLFSLFLVSRDLGEDGGNYLQQMADLSGQHEHEGIANLFRLATAISNKDSDPEASTLTLTNLINLKSPSRNYDIRHHVLAQYNLCELIITQYREHGDKANLLAFTKVLNKMRQTARDNNLINFGGEVSILESKLFTLQFDMDAARRTLLNTLDVAKEYGLPSLEADVKKEIESVVTGKSFSDDIDEMLEQTQIIKFLRSKGGSRGSLPIY